MKRDRDTDSEGSQRQDEERQTDRDTDSGGSQTQDDRQTGTQTLREVRHEMKRDR